MGGKCRKYSVCSLSLLGSILLLVGIILAALGSLKILAEKTIKEKIQLKAGSQSFEKWEKPDPRLREYYIFNITNSNTTNGRTPEIKQLGPYTYRKYLSYNITEQTDGTIAYIPSVQYIFDQVKSCKKCDPMKDKIITVNYPVLILTRLVSLNIKGSKPAANQINQLLEKSNIGLFQIRSVQEILWGYKDQVFSNVASGILKTSFPDYYALQRNNSGSGIAEIATGENDVDRVGEYVKWMTYGTLPWWNSTTANMINGTDGGRFRPILSKDDELYILVPEICRSVKILYDSSVKVDNIVLYRFTLPKEAFQSGDVNENNRGFCVTGSKKECLSTGLLDINVCRGGLRAPPVVASFPHFYLGNLSLAQYFDMTPVKSTDQTFLDVEPNTGVTMRFHKRLQVNMAISSFSIYNLLLNIDTTNPAYLPIFFTDESAQISDTDASEFKKQVLLPLHTTEAIPYVLLGIGGFLLLIAVVILFLHYKRRY